MRRRDDQAPVTVRRHHLFLQSLFAALAIALALALFDPVAAPFIVASFGASAFTAFTRPGHRTSSPRNMMGGYLTGLAVGCALHYLAGLIPAGAVPARMVYTFAGAIAVGLTMGLMIIFRMEHAPSCSIALGFVLNRWDHSTVIWIITGMVILIGFKRLLRGRMRDLW